MITITEKGFQKVEKDSYLVFDGEVIEGKLPIPAAALDNNPLGKVSLEKEFKKLFEGVECNFRTFGRLWADNVKTKVIIFARNIERTPDLDHTIYNCLNRMTRRVVKDDSQFRGTHFDIQGMDTDTVYLLFMVSKADMTELPAGTKIGKF